MSDRTNLIYEYDGSFDGMLCCVFESFSKRETPVKIRPAGSGELSLFPVRYIDTDASHAERVYRSLRKLGPKGEKLVETAFLYGLPGKEEAVCGFLRFAYPRGAGACRALSEAPVSRIYHIVRAVENESHLMREFLRFAQRGDGLTAVIEPKHYVLPLIGEHFCRRFPEETLLIWDKSHGMAMLYREHHAALIGAEDIRLPEEGEEERFYQELWKGYYDAIAIEARENPRCRMGHMPKRFWRNMVEVKGEM